MARKTSYALIDADDVRSSGLAGEDVERLVALGRALSDPIRVRMLGLMASVEAEGRECCGIGPAPGAFTDEASSPGVCVCEFEEYFGLGQSKVSYHLGKLKEAGLVHEERRGRWGFYSLDQETAQGLLDKIEGHLALRGPVDNLTRT